MDLSLVILLGVFFALVAIKNPICFALGLASVATMLYLDIPLANIANMMYTGLDSYPFLAVPFFMLVGALMNNGGITDRLMNVSDAWVGHIRGGLGHINILVSMLFAGLSGSSQADVAGIGTMIIPAMAKAGFDMPFTVAVTAASATLGAIMPPSIIMVVYASLAQVSTGALFLAGVVPGILIGLTQMVYCYCLAIKNNYPRNPKMPMLKRIKVTAHAAPALSVPLIILFGVSGGVFTVTESAAIAVLVSLILALFIYRTTRFRDLGGIFASSAVSSCVALFMMAIAGCCAWLVGYLNIPAMITDLVLSVTSDPHGIMLLLISVLFILGMLLNPATIIVAFMPVMLALGEAAHVHPLHLGIISNLVLSLAVITPPYGTSLLLAAQIGEISPMRAFWSTLPMLILAIAVIVVGVYFPELFLFLPRYFMPTAF
ncbi:MAG: TRAP transporter large permease [Pyramidobacter sp.]|nr:TRAP transporter large permease [Pyramidobacter sp.]